MKKTLTAAILGLAVMFTASVAKAELVTFQMDVAYEQGRLEAIQADHLNESELFGAFLPEVPNAKAWNGYAGISSNARFIDPQTGQTLNLVAPLLNSPLNDSPAPEQWFRNPHAGLHSLGIDTLYNDPQTELGAGYFTDWTGEKTSLSTASALSDLQKTQIQSLFDSAYYAIYGNGFDNLDELSTYASVLFSQALSHILYGSTEEYLNDPPDEFWQAVVWHNDWSILGFEAQETNVVFYDLWGSGDRYEDFGLNYADMPGHWYFFGVEGPGDDTVVPEPATLALLGLGFAGLGLARIRRRK